MGCQEPGVVPSSICMHFFSARSPERVQGKEYSSNCDVWSYGLVLFELATARGLPYNKISKNQP